MANIIGGPGVALPPPQALYPANLTPQGVPYTAASNLVSLAPGQSVQIPAGTFMIDLGKYSILEFQDPVTSASTGITQTAGSWRPIKVQRGTFQLRSDGVNFRISNLLGCPVSAVVTGGGNSYVQASTTVTVNTGNSTWQAVVGGRVGPISLTAVGAGYGLAPVVFIPAPPAPGVQATATATISAGILTAITVTNMGAGYQSAPTVTILPSPYDPSASSVTAATAAATLTGSGAVSAVICTNPGAPTISAALTLTIAGVGSGATAVASVLTTISSLSLTALGSGTISGGAMTTTGGVPVGNAFTNPDLENTNFLPRQAQIVLTSTGSTFSAYTIVDGGMFLATVAPLVMVYGGVVVNAATATLTQGSASDTVIIQPI